MTVPTYLYIKRHSVTGKCYFGKTIKHPETYLGSGLHWKRHIKQHGIEHVETLWYKLFTDQSECTRIALLFSEQQDIVTSEKWLNLVPENGLMGRVPGIKFSDEHRAKMSESGLKRGPRGPRSPETRAKLSESWKKRKERTGTSINTNLERSILVHTKKWLQ